jgi:hypothetical protein
MNRSRIDSILNLIILNYQKVILTAIVSSELYLSQFNSLQKLSFELSFKD